MNNLTYYFIYILYIIISSFVAYPLLKWKSQHPKSIRKIVDMVFLNFIILGLMPLIPFLMKHPPKRPVSASESYDYYDKKRIWIWNK